MKLRSILKGGLISIVAFTGWVLFTGNTPALATFCGNGASNFEATSLRFNDGNSLSIAGGFNCTGTYYNATATFNPRASVANAASGHNTITYDEGGEGDFLVVNVCNPNAGQDTEFAEIGRFWDQLRTITASPGAEMSTDPLLLETMRDAAAVNDGTQSTNGRCGTLPTDIAGSSDRQEDRVITVRVDLDEQRWEELTRTGQAADYPQWFPVTLTKVSTGQIVGRTVVTIPGAVAQNNGTVEVVFRTDASIPLTEQITPGEYTVSIFRHIFETVNKGNAPYVDSGGADLDFQGSVSVQGTRYDYVYDWLRALSTELGATTYPPGAPPASLAAPVAASEDPGTVDPGSEDVVNAEPTCFTAGGFLSWILCPVLTVLDESTQFLERQVQGFLFIDQQQFDRGGPIYQSWSSFRGIATVIIIIIAAIMIFSQAMGEGIFDNYSVKKLLPRLIMAGIAIQLSWFGMVLLIDIFNVLGDGIAGLMLNPFEASNGVALNADTNLRDLMGDMFRTASAGDFFTGLASVTIGGVALVGAFIALAIGAAAALFIGFITLIIRNMVIFLGVVFSPVAIAMSVLPGTQKTAKWWWESFEKALLMYPLVMAALSVGKILAVLLLNAAESDSDEGIKMTYVIAATVAWYSPFFLFSKLASAGGGALGKISGLAGDKSKGWFDKARSYNERRDKMKGVLKQEKRALAAGNDTIRGAYARNRLRSAAGAPMFGAIPGLPGSEKRENRYKSIVAGATSKANQQAIAEEKALLQDSPDYSKADILLYKAQTGTPAQARAAADRLVEMGRDKELRMLREGVQVNSAGVPTGETLAKEHPSRTMFGSMQASGATFSMKDKAPDIAKPENYDKPDEIPTAPNMKDWTADTFEIAMGGPEGAAYAAKIESYFKSNPDFAQNIDGKKLTQINTARGKLGLPPLQEHEGAKHTTANAAPTSSAPSGSATAPSSTTTSGSVPSGSTGTATSTPTTAPAPSARDRISTATDEEITNWVASVGGHERMSEGDLARIVSTRGGDAHAASAKAEIERRKADGSWGGSAGRRIT